MKVNVQKFTFDKEGRPTGTDVEMDIPAEGVNADKVASSIFKAVRDQVRVETWCLAHMAGSPKSVAAEAAADMKADLDKNYAHKIPSSLKPVFNAVKGGLGWGLEKLTKAVIELRIQDEADNTWLPDTIKRLYTQKMTENPTAFQKDVLGKIAVLGKAKIAAPSEPEPRP